MSEDYKIKVLIVDDEPLGRSLVRRMLDAHQSVEILGECENADEAVRAVRMHAPDLIFLDVQMPNRDGFAVLDDIGKEKLPAIVFVTAYDEYAVRAFEVNAVDYLLKPYDRKRFDAAFGRAAEHVRNQKDDRVNREILSLLSGAKLSEQFVERFIIKGNGRVFFLKAEEIGWIQAEGNYVLLHAARKKHIFREAIGNLESKLNQDKFRRISRSAIVNLDFVRELQPWFRGDYKVLLEDGTELKLSRRYRQNLTQRFSGSL